MRILKRLGKILLFLTFVFIFIKLFFPYYRVASYSMEPTIRKDQIVFVSRLHYKIFKPRKNDIVLLEPKESIFTKGVWIHRVIAIDGDIVEMKNGVVKVNGEEVVYPKIKKTEDINLKVPEGKIFQKGDSFDTIYGLVDKDIILGKVIFHF